MELYRKVKFRINVVVIDRNTRRELKVRESWTQVLLFYQSLIERKALMKAYQVIINVWFESLDVQLLRLRNYVI